VLFLRTWVLAQVLFFAGTMMPQRKFANNSCMGVVKATGTGSELRRIARTSATFQVMQVSEVFSVSLFPVLQWVLPSVGTKICMEYAHHFVQI
jgi:hypothetical protein